MSFVAEVATGCRRGLEVVPFTMEQRLTSLSPTLLLAMRVKNVQESRLVQSRIFCLHKSLRLATNESAKWRRMPSLQDSATPNAE